MVTNLVQQGIPIFVFVLKSKLARNIEFKFSDEEQRIRLLRIIRQCLSELSDHSSQSVRELSWLAPKMKDLTLSSDHFLSMLLPLTLDHLSCGVSPLVHNFRRTH